jgi:hypothetical protein
VAERAARAFGDSNGDVRFESLTIGLRFCRIQHSRFVRRVSRRKKSLAVRRRRDNQLSFTSKNRASPVKRPDGSVTSTPSPSCRMATQPRQSSPSTRQHVLTSGDDRPVLSPDGNALYFSSTRSVIGGDSDGDIRLVKRGATNQPLWTTYVGAATNLIRPDTSSTVRSGAISSNACTLYFASNRDAGQDFRVYRHPCPRKTMISRIVANATRHTAPAREQTIKQASPKRSARSSIAFRLGKVS